MGVTVDVFINFKGTRKELLKILADDFLILAGRKKCWFLNYIELGLSHRSDDEEYFVGHRFRPYNYVLWGTRHGWSTNYGTAPYAHCVIMDTIAQMLAIRLKTRTMICIRDFGDYRRYRHVRPMKRNKSCVILDEKTNRPPKDFFSP